MIMHACSLLVSLECMGWVCTKTLNVVDVATENISPAGSRPSLALASGLCVPHLLQLAHNTEKHCCIFEGAES